MAPFALDGSGGIMKLVGAIEIAALDAVEIAVEPWTWPFAQARRADIDRHFAARQRERPALWNGHSAAASLRAGEWRFAWGELRDRLCKLPGLARLGSSRSRRGQCRRRRCAAIGRWCLSVWSDGAVHCGCRSMGLSGWYAGPKRYHLSRHARSCRQRGSRTV